MNRSTYNDHDENEYFSTFSEQTLTEQQYDDLHIIRERANSIREEVSKPHKCAGNKCICNIIKLNLDVLETHINNLQDKLSNDRSKQES